jgi:L-alanine-DL-glutamate epimerase-like enolase superfamily enzyme
MLNMLATCHLNCTPFFPCLKVNSFLLLVSEMGVTPVLFEQPVHRDDWDGLRDVTSVAMEKYKVAVAADESCRSLLDAQKIIDGNLAHVINIKLAKLGVLGALEIIDAARKANIALMIGGMVETRIAMGFAGHLAAGLGCFRSVCCENYHFISKRYCHQNAETTSCTMLPCSMSYTCQISC